MTEMVRSEQQFLGNRARKWVPLAAGVAALLVADVALAATGGPFGAIGNFIQQNFMPAIGSIGIAGGIGYGAIHAFKHDYGKAIMGIGTAAGGGFLISQYGWFGQQAGIQAATLGGHITVAAALGHALGLL
ncbi:hypothetical protein [Acidithiobacillus caldus]|uniref:Uncharacterized protein n=1 Tax=Acidithiobacillus caldus (strain ATCC 51756 / DSM 8584 / KU) TaxID=637389 RepID=A0A059ZVW3_ACICK|nr:hypothetical protein [Acidithiobacillus caldus]AIA55720.1 hypothetical protein Acaty_c1861 [Acidithiobacillus caldus ATCC 51756]MBU2729265.1 hypothetical protein [Acidithiobacillus caldus]MBU2735784.1 hypothetical protein [Acidithiobacillus caldus ATCC 51756]MBU2743735.1 hypothetical protein [Acidithiobacillus caldus]MBU2780850.1 hypothetical protein [Acidithiobacillus caldus]